MKSDSVVPGILNQLWEYMNEDRRAIAELQTIIDVPEQMDEVERKAMIFAHKKHSEINQQRKYSGKPYIVHPYAVAELVRSVPHTTAMLSAAWLHDTIEDTNATQDEIDREFGDPIPKYVGMLTDISKPEDGNRKVRKEKDRQHLKKAAPKAKTVKLADLIHNSKSIIEEDPGFARVYLSEMRALLEVLKEGDPTLWRRAYKIAH